MQQARIEGYDPSLFDGTAFDLDTSRSFAGVLGLVWDLVSPDRVEAHLEVEDRHKMPFGNVHGGVHAALVEEVGSVASVARVLAEGKGAVGANNSTDFLRPVTGGRLDVVATPIHVGRSQHVWLVEVHDADGRLAATGRLRTHVIDRPPV